MDAVQNARLVTDAERYCSLSFSRATVQAMGMIVRPLRT
jgi:hypothetical protein